jgi:hypothetical protein
MYLFKTKQLICIAGFLLLGFSAQAQNNPNANKIYIQWQTSNCGINEDDLLIRTLLANASIMESQLMKGFREGPPTKYVQTTAAAELKRMRLNRKQIADGTLQTGLSKEDLQIATEIKPEAAKERIRKGIIKGWKTRALAGLSYLKTDDSIKLLERLAEDQSSEFNTFAKYLLARDKD